MMEVVFNYNELFCIRHSDAGDKAEPYMWFAFVFVDVNTITASRFVITLNMADQVSCRHLFQQGAESGDVIPIPPSVGHARILLDDTGVVPPAVIVVYALLEENETTDSLMTLGHKVFGQALDDEINDFVRKSALSPPPLSKEERDAMAGRIQKRVFDALEDAASWTECFNTRDRVVGFATEFFDWDALSVMRDGAPGQPFPIPRTIRGERLARVRSQGQHPGESNHSTGPVPGSARWLQSCGAGVQGLGSGASTAPRGIPQGTGPAETRHSQGD
jgi:hypothetical protein